MQQYTSFLLVSFLIWNATFNQNNCISVIRITIQNSYYFVVVGYQPLKVDYTRNFSLWHFPLLKTLMNISLNEEIQHSRYKLSLILVPKRMLPYHGGTEGVQILWVGGGWGF